MDVNYKTIDFFKEGTIYQILKTSYQRLLAYFPMAKGKFLEHWKQEDKVAFQNPDTIGKHILFTCIGNNPIGYFSWDDRNYPTGIIGQNCIVPNYRNEGLGSKQISILIKMFADKKFNKVTVVTGNHVFFKPAVEMYQRCGFRIENRIPGDLFEKIELVKTMGLR